MQRGIEIEAPARRVSKLDLFLAFLKVGLLGFGGVAPWVRHIIVEERGWLTEKEFASILGVGQVLPGPNTMNASVIIGDRFQGLPGAILCVAGQLAVPIVIVTSLGALYVRFAGVPEVHAALVGAGASAAGLVMGTAIKMARRIRPTVPALAVVACGFLAIGVLQWPLVPTVVGLVPLALGVALLERRA